jgi:hypothetical protein
MGYSREEIEKAARLAKEMKQRSEVADAIKKQEAERRRKNDEENARKAAAEKKRLDDMHDRFKKGKQ